MIGPRGAGAQPHPWPGEDGLRFVAIGDSLSAGFEGDTAEPWPDRVARALRRSGPVAAFANLAVAGATSTDVAAAQLDAAIELRPDLVSAICGANDVLLSVRPDPEGFEQVFDGMLATLACRVPGARVVTATYPPLATLFELRQRTLERVEAGMKAVNAAIRDCAARHGAIVLEWSIHPGIDDRENFASDGLHPSPIGHRRAAAAFLEGLRAELGPAFPSGEAATPAGEVA